MLVYEIITKLVYNTGASIFRVQGDNEGHQTAGEEVPEKSVLQ